MIVVSYIDMNILYTWDFPRVKNLGMNRRKKEEGAINCQSMCGPLWFLFAVPTQFLLNTIGSKWICLEST